MNDSSPSPQFDDFWEASSFNHYNIADFARGIETYSGKDKPQLSLKFPGKDYMLAKPKGALTKVMSRRISNREFDTAPLSEKQVGQLLSAFRTINGLEHRVFPSAGAAYPLEVFMVTLDVKGRLNRKVLYYNADNHSVSVVCDAPDWSMLAKLVNIQLESPPQAIIIFVLDDVRMTAKYGERGGRFALIEVGAAMQNLCLAIADNKLHGVALGGLLDEPWRKVLRLQNTHMRIALGYACGL